jgi:hypothetical protein
MDSKSRNTKAPRSDTIIFIITSQSVKSTRCDWKNCGCRPGIGQQYQDQMPEGDAQ